MKGGKKNMITVKRADAILKKFAGKKILVVGDLMLDRYVRGTVSRISPEAPVPVVRVREERSQPGGSANVALNIQSLGGQAVVAGIAGKDAAGTELEADLRDHGLWIDGLVRCADVATTVKTRIVAERQQVVRVDREDPPEQAGRASGDLCRRISKLVAGVSGVILEDYGKGAITQEVVDAVLKAAAAKGVMVGLDPKDNHELRISGITVATPNYKEAYWAAGFPESALRDDPTRDPRLREAADVLTRKWKSDFLVITLGPHGMYLLSGQEKPQIIPTKAREVFDVSGAGDTVIATALLALTAGARHYEAASLANHAAGVVVGKLGTATCSSAELRESVAAG